MLATVRRLQRALAREVSRAERDLERTLTALARLHAERLTSAGTAARYAALLRDLSEALARAGAAAHLSGRLDVRYPRAGAPEPDQFAAASPDLVPVVAFDAAIRDLESRDPIGAAELRASGLAAEALYAGVVDPATGEVFYPRVFYAARAADAEVAARVQERLVAGLREGRTTQEVADSLEDDWAWPGAYARTVARTNFNLATSAGRFVEAGRVARAGIPVGFRFSAVMDSDTRPGHAAMDGVVARQDDPIWRSWAPPLSWNCRCVLEPVIGDEVPVGFASVPPGASKDPGFGTRQDLRTL